MGTTALSTKADEAEVLERSAGDALDSAADPWSGRARRYVTALASDPSAYVANARVEARLLRVDGRLLPLIEPVPCAAHGPPQAYVCSPTTHFAAYTLEEAGKRRPGWAPFLRSAFAPLNRLMRAARFDRIVYVNNWLLSTNPVEELPLRQVQALTTALTTRFPDAAIVFPTVTPALHPAWYSTLADGGYRLVRSRRVFWMQPSPIRWSRRGNVLRDLRLTERTGYRVERDPERLGAAADRLAWLYRTLYLDKHSRLNAHYTADFIRLTLDEGILEYAAMARRGTIDAFVAWFVKEGLMTGALVGYDRSKPRRLGLYRQAFALLVAEAQRRSLPLNLSAGAGRFKMNRGAVPAEEYDAVYDRHLPARRRLPWALMGRAEAIAARRVRSGAA